jgi:hypothetical protein
LFARISGLIFRRDIVAAHHAVTSGALAIPPMIGTSVTTQSIETGDRPPVNGSTSVAEILL